jgi:hypothetical protein
MLHISLLQLGLCSCIIFCDHLGVNTVNSNLFLPFCSICELRIHTDTAWGRFTGGSIKSRKASKTFIGIRVAAFDQTIVDHVVSLEI